MWVCMKEAQDSEGAYPDEGSRTLLQVTGTKDEEEENKGEEGERGEGATNLAGSERKRSAYRTSQRRNGSHSQRTLHSPLFGKYVHRANAIGREGFSPVQVFRYQVDSLELAV